MGLVQYGKPDGSWAKSLVTTVHKLRWNGCDQSLFCLDVNNALWAKSSIVYMIGKMRSAWRGSQLAHKIFVITWHPLWVLYLTVCLFQCGHKPEVSTKSLPFASNNLLRSCILLYIVHANYNLTSKPCAAMHYLPNILCHCVIINHHFVIFITKMNNILDMFFTIYSLVSLGLWFLRFYWLFGTIGVSSGPYIRLKGD